MASVLRIKDKDGNIIEIPAIKGPKGEPFRFEDFTPDQLLDLTGENGVTYTPHINDDGTLSWTNDGGLPNPDPIYIRGSRGESAYDQAKMGGYTGTLSEFYEALANISNISSGVSTGIYTGPDEPTDEKYQYWVDTFSDPALLKYKDQDGLWQVIAGGGGGGTGGDTPGTSPIEFNVTPEWHTKTIAYGKSCILNIEWSSLNRGNPTGNGSIKIYQYISENETVLKDAYSISQGKVPIDFTNYLILGSNSFLIEIRDRTGQVAELYPTINTRSYSIDTDTWDVSQPFSGDNIVFYYTPRGAGKKIVYISIDGNSPIVKEVMTDGIVCEYPFKVTEHGRHTISVYFTCQINEEDSIIVDPIYYEFAYIVPGNLAPIITANCGYTEMKQYEILPIDIRVFTPREDGTAETMTPILNIYESTLDHILETDSPISTYTNILSTASVNYPYKAKDTGSNYILIESGATVLPIPIEVSENTVNVEAVTGGTLVLHLTSNKRNNSEDRSEVSKWSYGGIDCELTGFNFTPGSTNDGWVPDDTGKNTVLRVKGDARVFIPIDIFTDEVKQLGRTIELEFATRDVLDYDAIIMECLDNAGKGFKVTSHDAVLKSLSNQISAQYKDEEQTRISFVIQPSNSVTHLMSIYINGVHSGVVQYDGTDSFTQSFPPDVRPGITIGSNLCTTDIYSIRVYKAALTSRYIVNNWIADTQDIETLLERYKRNDIYDENMIISKDKLPKTLPYMIVNATEDGGSNQLPQTKKDKRPFSGQFIDPLHPERCFTFTNAIWRVQGTSSEGYYRKNYDMDISESGIILNGQKTYLFQLNDSAIPTNYFCFKADVASSEGANNVELVRLFNDIAPKIPPQEDDPRKRQGIDGFPMVMFRYDGTNYHFLGKYNFNNSKSTPEVFGMESGVQSWEVTNNGSLRVIYKEVDFREGSGWEEDFEARYPDKYKDYELLETLTSWIKSTDRGDATGASITPTTLPKIVRTVNEDTGEEKYEVQEGTMEYKSDTKEYRLAKFRDECHRFFDVEHLQFFWLFTEFFLMIDNRAKNTFPTRYLDDKWYMLPYDYDTALGINNVGALTFGFSIEDVDYDTVWDAESQTYKTEYKFNGAESVLWCNVRDAFKEEIEEMYCELRRNQKLTYEEVTRRFDDHQSSWGEAIYNEDAQVKYIDPYVLSKDGQYFSMLQGNKKSQREYWLYNRFKYYDSKCSTDDVRSDKNIINLRTNVPNPITIVPYSDMYAAILYDKINLAKERAYKDQPCELPFLKNNPEDCVTWILSASDVAEIYGLPNVGVSSCNIAPAIKLRSIIIGSEQQNSLLKTFTCGNNILLTKIDLRNCTGLSTSIQATGCTNIEEVYLQGTNVLSCSLPIGGTCRILHLPGTVNNLTLINHKISEFSLPKPNYSEKYDRYYGNLLTLSLTFSEFDNTMRDTLDIKELLNSLLDNAEALGTKASLRIQNFKIDGNDSYNTIDEVLALYRRIKNHCRGVTFPTLNSEGAYETKEQENIELIGSIRVTSETIDGSKLAECKAMFPDVTILYNTIEATVKFYADEEMTRLYDTQTKTTKPGEKTLTFNNPAYTLGAPTKYKDDDEDEEARYVFTGWRVVSGNTKELQITEDLVTGVTENTVFVAEYRKDTKYYRTFLDCEDRKFAVLKPTAIYYELAGENDVVEPKMDKTKVTYIQQTATGLRYNMYFDKWRDQDNYSHAYSGEVPNIEKGHDTDITYIASYAGKRLYKLNFIAKNSAGADVTYATAEYEAGQKPKNPGSPAMYMDETYHHTFSYWADQNGQEINWNTYTMTSGDKYIYAKYEDHLTRYTVRFIKEGSILQTTSDKPYSSSYGDQDSSDRIYTGSREWNTTYKTVKLSSWKITYKLEGNTYYLDYVAVLDVEEELVITSSTANFGTSNVGSRDYVFDKSPSTRYGMNIGVIDLFQFDASQAEVYAPICPTSFSTNSEVTNIEVKSIIDKDGYTEGIKNFTCRYNTRFEREYWSENQRHHSTISGSSWLIADKNRANDVELRHDRYTRYESVVSWINNNKSKVLPGSTDSLGRDDRLILTIRGSNVYVKEVYVKIWYRTY